MSTWERATFESEDTMERRRSAKAVVFSVGVAAMVALRAAPSVGALLVFGATLAAVLVLALRANPWPRLVRVRTYAGREGLYIDRRLIERDRIESAVLVPGDGEGRPYVRIAARGALPIEVGVPSPDDGRALLRALGFDAAQHALEFRATSIAGVIITLFCLLPLLALPAIVDSDLVPFALVIAGAVVLAMMLFPTKVSVGADGVSIRRFGQMRFIPSGDIEWVQTYDSFQSAETARGVVLVLKSGEHVKIPIGGNGIGKSDGTKEITAFIERVEEAIEAHRTSEREPPVAALDRGGRTALDWLRALRRIGAGANATLRNAPTMPDRLVRLVESPSARPIDRAAAAVALQSSSDPDARARVRVAATAVADQRLRVALEAVAEGDDARLEAALEELAFER